MFLEDIDDRICFSHDIIELNNVFFLSIIFYNYKDTSIYYYVCFAYSVLFNVLLYDSLLCLSNPAHLRSSNPNFRELFFWHPYTGKAPCTFFLCLRPNFILRPIVFIVKS